MSKCGIIAKDVDSGKLKYKMYNDEEGNFKGEARCGYMKVIIQSYIQIYVIKSMISWFFWAQRRGPEPLRLLGFSSVRFFWREFFRWRRNVEAPNFHTMLLWGTGRCAALRFGIRSQDPEFQTPGIWLKLVIFAWKIYFFKFSMAQNQLELLKVYYQPM